MRNVQARAGAIMKASLKTNLVRQCIYLAAAAAAAFLTVLYESRTLPPELAEPKRLLSDGCFVSAVLFLSLGALSFVIYWGGFDSFSYIIAKFKHKTEGTYFDYVKEKHADKKSPSPLFFTTGLIMLALSIGLIL
ncbi:MAG: DUF3899 domain-containing protein, partial [Treponema sp.]|nr:DUF3899 domain-containing protein [Treponema sp.]